VYLLGPRAWCSFSVMNVVAGILVLLLVAPALAIGAVLWWKFTAAVALVVAGLALLDLRATRRR